MTHEHPAGENEGGLPNKQGEFAIVLPWILRCGLAITVGGIVGFAASIVLAPRWIGHSASWSMIAAGAGAATLLSIRKVHAWQVSTFTDGTLVGAIASPIFAILLVAVVWGSFGYGYFFYAAFIGLAITVPCGWVAGFTYHLLLSAAERARRGEDDSA